MSNEELRDYEVQKNPNDFLSKRRETSTSIFTEITLLIQRSISETKKYNGKILYSFPLKSLVFSDESDLLKFELNPEMSSGIFQIKTFNVINIESSENGINCTQKMGISFVKNWRDFSFQVPYRYPLFFKENKDFSVIFDVEDIKFLDEKSCIYDESNSFYFVSKLKYEAIKFFILDALANLKK